MEKLFLHPLRRSSWSSAKLIFSWRHYALLAAVLLLLPGLAEGLYAQKAPGHGAVWNRVAQAKSAGEPFETARIFDAATKRDAGAYRSAVQQGDVFDLRPEEVQTLLASEPGQLELAVPATVDGKPLKLELVKVNLLAEDFKFAVGANPGAGIPFEAGLHYQGAVAGDPSSLAAISIYQGQAMGLIVTRDGAYTLGKIKGAGLQHILYRNDDLKNVPNFECGTPDGGDGYKISELEDSKSMPGSCPIGIYVEIGYSIYSGFGNDLNATFNFAIGLFNQSFILYANESITMELTQVLAWTAPDPYSGPSVFDYLAQFQANTGAFNGDLGALIVLDNVGGVAATINGLCDPDTDQRLCINGLVELFYEDVPVFTFNVYVITHEMGHLLGSRHTHACVWNGNNTAIDGCAGSVEGDCPLPGSPPGGGTIMSYCHNDPVSIDFTQGFGPQPGNVIRNVMSNAPCVTDGDGDGLCGDDDPCPDDPDNDGDGDGVCGDIDNCTDTANPSQADADGDGFGDACDACPNDPDKTKPGICGCGVADTDSDNDGLADCIDACPNDPDNDADGDGVCGDVDNCPATANADQADSDDDGLGDACDQDEACINEVVDDLTDYVNGLNISSSKKRAINSRLELAESKFCRYNAVSSAIATLEYVIDYVDSQRGRGIPAAAADHIIAQVDMLIDALEDDNAVCCSANRSVNPGQIAVAEGLELEALPNPFTRQTSLRYYLPQDGRVQLSIFSIHGQEVAKVVDGQQEAGAQRVEWRNEVDLPAGVYFARLQTESGVSTLQLVLAK